jgi:hypothetical protein
MQLDPAIAQTFFEDYRHILLMVYGLKGLKGHRTTEERMVAARGCLMEIGLLDEAVEALEDRKGLFVDEDVVSAIRTLEVGKWVYLRDLRHHTILLHPDGYIARGVVGLTRPIRDLTGGPGFSFEAGIMAIPGHFICDGLLAEIVALGPGYQAHYNPVFKELKAIGAFHQVPNPGFLRPPRDPTQADYQAAPVAKAAKAGGAKVGSRPAAGPTSRTPDTLASVVAPAAPAAPRKASAPARAPKAKDDYREVIQLKVTLAGIEPPIWRRLQVPADWTLARLHRLIQAAFGWEDCHLHCFRIHGEAYAPTDQENEPGTCDEKVPLKRVGLRLRTRFRYEYDFGDDWEHLILVEGLLLLEEPATVPACIGGQRACPPEDVGGAGGYQQMLEALGNPRDPRNQEFGLWLGTRTWNAEAFDLDQVNEAIAKATGPGGSRR